MERVRKNDLASFKRRVWGEHVHLPSQYQAIKDRLAKIADEADKRDKRKRPERDEDTE